MEMKTFSKEVKDKVLSRINNDGLSVAKAAEEAGLSVPTVYEWTRKARTEKVISTCCYCKVDFLPGEPRVETSLSIDTKEYTYHPKCWWSAMDDLEREDLAMKKLAMKTDGKTPKLPPK